MLANEMPNCLCGNKAWQPGGGQMGPGGSSQWFRCDNCKRLALNYYYGTGIILISVRRNPKKFSKTEIDYVNGPLMTALRFRQQRVEEAREVVENRQWDRAMDQLGLPRGVTHIQYVPKDKHATLQALLRDSCQDPEWKVPPGCAEVFVPPQVPPTLVAFTLQQHRSSRWRPVSREETMGRMVPLDPIRIDHDKGWKEIFEALRPLANIKPREIKNQYGGSPHQPWYEFKVGETKFVVGPRSHVVAIDVEFPVGVCLNPIIEVGKRDNVTSEWGHKNGCIHAWNKYRVVEYLSILIRLANWVKENVKPTA